MDLLYVPIWLSILQDIKREKWVLTDEGKLYATTGSPEIQLYSVIPAEGISPDELQVGGYCLQYFGTFGFGRVFVSVVL